MSHKLTAKLQQIKVKNLVLPTNWKEISIESSYIGKLLSKKGQKERLLKKRGNRCIILLFSNTTVY